MAIRNNTSPSRENETDAAVLAKRSEQLKVWIKEFRVFSDVFLDAYCVVDLSYKVVDFNVAFSELAGESYRKILKIGFFSDLVKTEFCPHQSPPKQIILSEKSIRLDEVSAQSKAFPNLRLILAGIPIFSPEKEILGCLLNIRDVSAESALQQKYLDRKEESITDGLTRLYNKAFTEQLLHKSIKGSFRDSKPCSVMMCDVDHFKKVNDTFGHQAGDYVLTTVAQMLKGEVRANDIVGRFGGEEFVVVLPGNDVGGTLTLAERFRKRVQGAEVMFEGRRIPLTISIGTATFSQGYSPGMDVESLAKDLVNRADIALYQAKETGRNKVCQHEKLPK